MDPRDSKADIHALLNAWLTDAQNGPWLIVLDGVQHSDFLIEGDLYTAILADSIRARTHGSFLITSRSENAVTKLVAFEDIVFVPPMQESEAVELLEKKLGKQADNRALAAALDYLPIALTSAATYIRGQGPQYSVSEYLKRMQERDRSVKGVHGMDSADSQMKQSPESEELEVLTRLGHIQKLIRELREGSIPEQGDDDGGSGSAGNLQKAYRPQQPGLQLRPDPNWVWVESLRKWVRPDYTRKEDITVDGHLYRMNLQTGNMTIEPRSTTDHGMTEQSNHALQPESDPSWTWIESLQAWVWPDFARRLYIAQDGGTYSMEPVPRELSSVPQEWTREYRAATDASRPQSHAKGPVNFISSLPGSSTRQSTSSQNLPQVHHTTPRNPETVLSSHPQVAESTVSDEDQNPAFEIRDSMEDNPSLNPRLRPGKLAHYYGMHRQK